MVRNSVPRKECERWAWDVKNSKHIRVLSTERVDWERYRVHAPLRKRISIELSYAVRSNDSGDRQRSIYR
jgi:hypothetical protein